MEANEIFYHVINSLHGGSVARQFQDVLDGEPVEDQNESAIKDVVKVLERIKKDCWALSPEAEAILDGYFAA